MKIWDWLFKQWIPLGLGVVAFASLLVTDHLAGKWHEETLKGLAQTQAGIVLQSFESRLAALVERAKFLSDQSETLGRNPEAAEKALKEFMANDKNFVALAVYHHTYTEWVLTYRLIRPTGDPLRLTREDFEELNRKYPAPFPKFPEKNVSFTLGSALGNQPMVRIAKALDEETVLLIDSLYASFGSVFTESASLFSYVFTSDGKLLFQSDSNHFVVGDNLSHLPLFDELKEKNSAEAFVKFKELPEAPKTLAFFKKWSEGDLVFVSQGGLAPTPLSLYPFQLELGILLVFAIPGFFGALVLLFKKDSMDKVSEVAKVLELKTGGKSPEFSGHSKKEVSTHGPEFKTGS